jgi:hypothetical protein
MKKYKITYATSDICIFYMKAESLSDAQNICRKLTVSDVFGMADIAPCEFYLLDVTEAQDSEITNDTQGNLIH